jgi:CRP-like cAMP-binding protein
MAADDQAPREDAALRPLLAKLLARDVLDDEEQEALRESLGEIRSFPAGKVIVRAGATLSHSTLLMEGFICRYRDLSDGQRQILELHVPGDFLDLHGFLLSRLEHNVGSLTPVRVALVPHDRLRVITERFPHLSRMLWLSTLMDAAIHRERILSVGRRSAMARIAHLLCELYVRLELVGLAAHCRYQLPLTQTDIADANGLTPVQVNRMLKQLRDQGLLTYRQGEVVIQDWDELQRLAEFNPGYLYLERRPR